MKKIAIIYPKGDNIAEEIAIKLMLNFDKVYVIHPRFSKPKIILDRLEKVKSAFFLGFSPELKIDKNTKKYLEFLMEKNKKIFAILSENFNFPYRAEKIEKYNLNDIEGTFQKIYSVIGELVGNPKNWNYENIFRAYIPILLISPKLKKFSRKNFLEFFRNFKKSKRKIKNIKTEYQNQRHRYW
jgi:hypothetical protein